MTFYEFNYFILYEFNNKSKYHKSKYELSLLQTYRIPQSSTLRTFSLLFVPIFFTNIIAAPFTVDQFSTQRPNRISLF